MPVFVEDPAQFSKERLKSELIANNVELPPAESKKRVYLELYLKSVKTNSTDFSSDEEDDHLNGNAEEEEEEVSDMVDLHLLTDDQLKARLLQYGVKPGPIVASTRALYEKKLHRLMDGPAQISQHRVNGTGEAGQYSDSEEETGEDEDKESESEQFRSDTVSQTENSKTASKVGSRNFYPQCFLPSAGWGRTLHRSSDTSKNGSFGQTGSLCRSFSISQMVEEIENRFSPQSKHTEIKRRSGQKNNHTVNYRSLQEPVTDVLTEMFPDTAKTPTGIYATKRRPIKGAAGRPVQFKYPEMPLLSPTTLERQEIQQRLVPLWVQMVVFLLVACLLYLIYLSMEDSLSNPFTAVLDALPDLISSSQDTPATDAAA